MTCEEAVKKSSATDIFAVSGLKKKHSDIDLIFHITSTPILVIFQNDHKQIFVQTAINIRLINKLFATSNIKGSLITKKIHYLF